ncbi:MAG: hypothetical protein HOE11_04125 [Candidatus Diapherotrites archaeon]|jgi:hypothetical protein|nr:hypothetical protein [Candidatus Diapherotrites archaeon]MBT4597040.1 hypothetical protein [Candidatus Diapherotrites archaeon]
MAVKKKKVVRKPVKKAVKKKTTKQVVKKKVVKATKKVTVSKTVKKQIATNKKKTAKALKHNTKQDSEISKLQEEVAKLQGKGKKTKKKVNSKRISEYNLFIRKQIKAGFSFVKAVKEWNRYQALMAKDKRRPSAYNQFIGSQMRLGKTFLQSVALWKLAKAGKLGRKGTTRTVEKIKYKTRTIKSKPTIIVKKVRSKPTVVEKIKYKTRTVKVPSEPTVVTKIKYRTKEVPSTPKVITKIKYRTKEVPSKPKVITKIKYRTKTVKVPVESKSKVVRQTIDYAKLRDVLAGTKTKTETISKTDIKTAMAADDEEIAFRIVQTYFKEIARFGFKKRLTLDEILDAYVYALARVKRNEAVAVEERVRRAGMKK